MRLVSVMGDLMRNLAEAYYLMLCSFIFLSLIRFEKQLDKHSVPLMLFMLANRWLATRFDVMTTLLGCLTATSIVLTHGSIPPGLAGLALTFTMQVLRNGLQIFLVDIYYMFVLNLEFVCCLVIICSS